MYSQGQTAQVHFLDKGKKQAFLLMVSDVGMCKAMKIVGSSFDADVERLEGCAQFVSSLYGHSGSDADLVCYNVFWAQTCHFPLTKDALE